MKYKVFLLLSLLSILIGLTSCNGSDKDIISTPLVKKGVLDLRGWNFEDNGIVKIKGEFEFVWKRFITSYDFKKLDSKDYTYYPSTWGNREIGKAKISPQGYASYRFQVLLPENTGELGLWVNDNIYTLSPHRVYINNKEVINIGKVGTSKENSTVGILPEVQYFKTTSKVLDVVVHISNFHMAEGGTNVPIELGLKDDIKSARSNEKILDAFLIGSICIMALYHFVLFILRRTDMSPLFYGLFCLAMALRAGITGNANIFQLLFPYASVEIIKKIEYIGFYISPATIGSFVYILYPNIVSKWKQRITWPYTALFVLQVIIFDKYVYHSTLVAFQLFTLVFIITIVSVVAWAAKRNFDGAKTLLLGIFIFSSCAIHDILLVMGIFEGAEWSHFGLYAFLISQALVISARFSKAFGAAEVAIHKNKLLSEVDKQKTHFFQNISHELRTPLTLIMNPLEEEKEKSPENANIDVAVNNVKRLYRLVNQLLDFQKITAGKVEHDCQPIEIGSFLHTCAGYFRPSCKKKNIKFSFMNNLKKEQKVYADIDSLEKIVFNYLSNALKYTPEDGSIRLILSYEKGSVRIAVRDTGPGINKESQGRLFKVFSQVDEETNREFEGTGLGLSLVKELTEELHGEVGVVSKEGEGAEFWVTLPILKEEKPIIDILIVEDEPEMLDLYDEFIFAYSKDVKYNMAKNSKEARAIIASNRIKCIISDAVMPGESGLDLLKYVSEKSPETVKILATGRANDQLLEEAINKSKIDNVMYKPISAIKLYKILDTALQRTSFRDSRKSFDLKDYKPKEWLIEGHIGSKSSKLENDIANITPYRKETVLVVEDLKDMANLIAKTLLKQGFKVIKAENGKRAIEIVQQEKPSLIITDWMMPEMSGIDFLNLLKQDDYLSTIPTIMLTAKAEDESRIVGKESGATAYLGKPFESIELISTVNNLLRIKEGEEKIKELNRELTENVLKRFLSPILVEKIIAGEMNVKDEPQVKQVTILFSDICQFTSKSSELGPRKMIKLLNEYLSEMNQVIFKYNGMIDKFVGDSIMVIFGAPIELEAVEQVKMATRCAMDMQERINTLNKKWKREGYPELSIRIGLHHGPAIVGYIGSEERYEYTAIGPTVNMASRIESVSGEGKIFVSEIVRDFLDECEWAREGDFELKGISRKVPLYSVSKMKSNKKAA